jgi:hypothetical protein
MFSKSTEFLQDGDELEGVYRRKDVMKSSEDMELSTFGEVI